MLLVAALQLMLVGPLGASVLPVDWPLRLSHLRTDMPSVYALDGGDTSARVGQFIIERGDRFASAGDLKAAEFLFRRVQKRSRRFDLKLEASTKLLRIKELQLQLEQGMVHALADEQRLRIDSTLQRALALLLNGRVEQACKYCSSGERISLWKSELETAPDAADTLMSLLTVCRKFRAVYEILKGGFTRFQLEFSPSIALAGGIAFTYASARSEGKRRARLERQARRYWSSLDLWLQDQHTSVTDRQLYRGTLDPWVQIIYAKGRAEEHSHSLPSWAHVQGTGGWQILSDQRVECDFPWAAISGSSHVEICSDCSPEIFLLNFVDAGKPVIMQNSDFRDTQLLAEWSRERMLQAFGDSSLMVSASTDIVPRQWVADCRYKSSLGDDCSTLHARDAFYFQKRWRVRDFVQQAYVPAARHNSSECRIHRGVGGTEPFAFTPLRSLCSDEYAAAMCPSLREEALMPWLRRFIPAEEPVGSGYSDRWDSTFLSLGPSGSGVYFHLHGATLHMQLYGRKKWFIFPPKVFYGPTVGSLKFWAKNVKSQLPMPPLELVQYPGEVFYLPAGWPHATLNIDDAVGFAVQIED